MTNLYATIVIPNFVNENFSRKGPTRHHSSKERNVDVLYLTADGYKDPNHGVLEKEEGNGEKRTGIL